MRDLVDDALLLGLGVMLTGLLAAYAGVIPW